MSRPSTTLKADTLHSHLLSCDFESLQIWGLWLTAAVWKSRRDERLVSSCLPFHALKTTVIAIGKAKGRRGADIVLYVPNVAFYRSSMPTVAKCPSLNKHSPSLSSRMAKILTLSPTIQSTNLVDESRCLSSVLFNLLRSLCHSLGRIWITKQLYQCTCILPPAFNTASTQHHPTEHVCTAADRVWTIVFGVL